MSLCDAGIRPAVSTGGERPSWEKVDAIFTHAIQLDPEERAAFLEQAVEGSAALRRSVTELLAIDTEAQGSRFLSRPAVVTWRSLWEEAVHDLLDGGHDLSGITMDEALDNVGREEAKRDEGD